MDKKEEEDDSIFTTWRQGFDQEVVTEELDAERKSSLNVPRPRRSIANRRASLPCPATLNAMQLQHLHNATMAPNPASHSTRKEGELRQHYRACHAGINGGDVCPKANSTPERERRAPAIPTIPEVTETPEKKTRFRGRNVMSLSDADSICLICHHDLHKGGGGVRELHCTHSFHSECIEEWLWRKQACPTCRVHVAMPEPLYWTSTRVKVP
ncbi:probable E3 ubiquitin-protein ligase RHG1A [Alosa alosa]|uniref:probable E3 ubiquitin-protein ligase RHG1A isoform X1 n=1 Tax=Alosa sapidissima TaxID=34773 RepID=UPI001C0A1D3A|nr:probable E3 ubiquitin-protein ligase RHG1A isoform X1 [Alosa sapidissima]XP_048091504.1 probable E3 ubiquitin-protein ligase RHG1A [Alosa alosa]